MNTPTDLLGTWIPDFDRWTALDPDMGPTVGGGVAQLLVSNAKLVFEPTAIVFLDFGKRPRKEYGASLRSDDGGVATFDVTLADRGGVYEVTREPNERLVVRLLEPKRDVSAWRRPPT